MVYVDIMPPTAVYRSIDDLTSNDIVPFFALPASDSDYSPGTEYPTYSSSDQTSDYYSASFSGSYYTSNGISLFINNNSYYYWIVFSLLDPDSPTLSFNDRFGIVYLVLQVYRSNGVTLTDSSQSEAGWRVYKGSFFQPSYQAGNNMTISDLSLVSSTELEELNSTYNLGLSYTNYGQSGLDTRDPLSFLVSLGQKLSSASSGIASIIGLKIGDTTFAELLFSSGFIIFMGWVIVKWIIPT